MARGLLGLMFAWYSTAAYAQTQDQPPPTRPTSIGPSRDRTCTGGVVDQHGSACTQSRYRTDPGGESLAAVDPGCHRPYADQTWGSYQPGQARPAAQAGRGLQYPGDASRRDSGRTSTYGRPRTQAQCCPARADSSLARADS